MNCTKCHAYITIKETERWISMLCKCKVTIIYPNGLIKVKTKEEYDPNYKNHQTKWVG